MQRVSISMICVLLGISLDIAALGDSNAKVAITRSERCTNLSHQFDDALKTHAAATQITAAKALERGKPVLRQQETGTGDPDACKCFEAAWSDSDRPGSVTLNPI